MVEEDTDFITFDGDVLTKSGYRDEIINKYMQANIDGLTKITDFTIGSEAYHLADVMASLMLEHRELIDLNYRMSMIYTAEGAQKITLADTGIDFPTYEGSNKITVGTTIQPSAVLVEGDFIFVSMGPEITYTVSYYNYDGQLLGTESVVTTLGVPADANGYSGTAPTKASTAQYTYTFSGWNADSTATTADADALKNITANRKCL